MVYEPFRGVKGKGVAMVKKELGSHESYIKAEEEILDEAAASVAANKLVTGSLSFNALEEINWQLEQHQLQQLNQLRQLESEINQKIEMAGKQHQDTIDAYEDNYENYIASHNKAIYEYSKNSASFETQERLKSRAEAIHKDSLESYAHYKKIQENALKTHEAQMENLKKQRNWLVHAGTNLLEKMKIKKNENIEDIFKAAYLKSKK